MSNEAAGRMTRRFGDPENWVVAATKAGDCVQIQNAGIFANPQKSGVLPVARRLLAAAAQIGLGMCGEPWLAEALGDKSLAVAELPASRSQVLIVLGGDGTLLRAAQQALAYNIPLFGVNLGRVGFLTEVEPCRAEAAGDDDPLLPALKALTAGAYTLEQRLLLSVTPPRGEPQLALNDAVIARGGFARMIGIDAFLSDALAKDALVDRYVADGLVVSTPTGSTAYSLSAGGPVVAPDVACFVLAPICPHTLRSRPVVFSAERAVRLHLHADQGTESMVLTVDGRHIANLAPGDDVWVRRAERTVAFIRLQPPDFFGLLRHKLSEWSV